MGACSYSLTAQARGSPVGTQPVGPMHGGARRLTGGEEAGDDLVRFGSGRVEHLAEVVGRDAAHVVVHRGQHGDRVLGHVDP